jgi:hypothetical protein
VAGACANVPPTPVPIKDNVTPAPSKEARNVPENLPIVPNPQLQFSGDH